MNRQIIFALGAITIGLVTQRADPASHGGFAGSWTGTADVFVSWTRQRVLPVALDIHTDGTVEGHVGDARLTDGRLRSNRGSFGRALHVKTDWIITGQLAGPLIAAESVYRERVTLPLNWSGTEFSGSVQSSGSMFGGKDRMALAAGHLVLRRR